jgi:hypothetical protein
MRTQPYLLALAEPVGQQPNEAGALRRHVHQVHAHGKAGFHGRLAGQHRVGAQPEAHRLGGHGPAHQRCDGRRVAVEAGDEGGLGQLEAARLAVAIDERPVGSVPGRGIIGTRWRPKPSCRSC